MRLHEKLIPVFLVHCDFLHTILVEILIISLNYHFEPMTLPRHMVAGRYRGKPGVSLEEVTLG